MISDSRVEGRVLLDGQDIYDPRVNPVRVRQKVGMVFQKPNPFPTMTIRENVLAGLRLQNIRQRRAEDLVERALRRAALWDEVKDKLKHSGANLSGGQQQRLCIARALVLEPEVLLMDEPCSALDPVATARIEDLIHELQENYTVVVVTHNMQQAGRLADDTAFFLLGELVEFEMGKTVDEMIRDSITALVERDSGLARRTIEQDHRVNQLEVDTVVTLCAEEVCVSLPRGTRQEDWIFPDPAAFVGDADEILSAFRKIRDGVREKIETLLRQ